MTAYVEERVAAVLSSDAVQRELSSRLERERQAIEQQVGRLWRCGVVCRMGCGVPDPSHDSGPTPPDAATTSPGLKRSSDAAPADRPAWAANLFSLSVGRQPPPHCACYTPCVQVERELVAERERALIEEEARREAIRAQHAELAQLEAARRREVRSARRSSQWPQPSRTRIRF